jgi:hypothetical protein
LLQELARVGGIERELARQMDLKTSAKLSQSVKSSHPRKPRLEIIAEIRIETFVIEVRIAIFAPFRERLCRNLREPSLPELPSVLSTS